MLSVLAAGATEAALEADKAASTIVVLKRVSVTTLVDCAAAAAVEDFILAEDAAGAAELRAPLACAALVPAAPAVALAVDDEAASATRPPLTEGATALTEACSG